jgi:hypothetical protein
MISLPKKFARFDIASRHNSTTTVIESGTNCVGGKLRQAGESCNCLGAHRATLDCRNRVRVAIADHPPHITWW